MNEDMSIRKTLIELNKGREGKTAIAVNGNEIKSSVYLGDGNMAAAEGRRIEIEKYSFSTGKYETISFSKEIVKWLSRL